MLDDGFEVRGVPIPRGSKVGLMIGSSNRDPEKYEDPDAFRIARGETSHLSFGGGIHFCIGAPLARLELETTLVELARTEEELVILEPTRDRTGRIVDFVVVCLLLEGIVGDCYIVTLKLPVLLLEFVIHVERNAALLPFNRPILPMNEHLARCFD